MSSFAEPKRPQNVQIDSYMDVEVLRASSDGIGGIPGEMMDC